MLEALKKVNSSFLFNQAAFINFVCPQQVYFFDYLVDNLPGHLLY